MIKFKTPEIDKISDILKSIYRTCGEKGIEFECTMELDHPEDNKENTVTYDQKNKKMLINFVNLEEKNLIENLLHWEEKIKTTL
jgi:hypothetical protein